MRRLLIPKLLVAQVKSGLTTQEQLLFEQLRMISPKKFRALFRNHAERDAADIIAKTRAVLQETFHFALSSRRPRNDPAEYMP